MKNIVNLLSLEGNHNSVASRKLIFKELKQYYIIANKLRKMLVYLNNSSKLATNVSSKYNR